MGLNHYILTVESKGSDAVFELAYKNKRFFRLEHKRGRLVNSNQWMSLMYLVPDSEDKIEDLAQKYREKKITYLEVKKNSSGSLFTSFNEEFFLFYKQKTGIDYNYRAIDGKAMKSIITSIHKLSASEEECLNLWLAILTNWSQLDTFYQSQLELKQINANLNIILRQIKNGKPTDQNRKQANNNANDLRKSL